MKFKILGFAAPACAALLAAVPASAAATSTGTALAVTSPASGASVSLSSTPNISISGTVGFATPTEFFLRRDGCGTSNDNPHLSVTAGYQEAGDGCGFLLGVAGPTGTVDHNLYTDFPSTDGMPLIFNAKRPVSGSLQLDDFSVSGNGAAVGQVTVSFAMEALYKGTGITVGSATETVTVTPGAATYAVPFSFTPNSQLNGKSLSGVDLRVDISGPYVLSGFIGVSGASYVIVPATVRTYTRGVQVSVDDSSFKSPLAATLSNRNTAWSLTIPTPAVGSHTIYVRAVQGAGFSQIVAQPFSVTS